MLSKEQKLVLAQLIYNDRELLFGDCGPNLSKVEKQEKWIEIFIKLNSMGANIPDYKSLRDVEWSNMRRAAEKKIATIKDNESKAEEERINVRPLTNIDEIVLDILGKGSGCTQKNEVDIPESAATGYLDPMHLTRVKFEGDDDDDDDDAAGAGSCGSGSHDDYNRSSSSGMMTRKRKKRRGEAGQSVGAALQPAVRNSQSGVVDLMHLRRKKLRLECAKLELDIERIPLECAKLELEILKLQREVLTSSSQNSVN